MRNLSAFFLIVATFSLLGCGKADQINGHNSRTAYRSVKVLKERLPPEKRIEFEVSFWTIRDAFPDTDAFLSQVDGKNPNEIIIIGREIYQHRKNQGFEAYDKYQSWEDMIAQFSKERLQQDRTTKADRIKEKANDVLYKL
ncbi:MAG: hypothetical protein CVV13_03465 [Gammaproteobacteria bacterium HGW-Gammaproteobacteria-3]|nr:MAG: hypothetical protein CVV13_03465 [Gammaproteobacteria bacterium HGW-Gammaproteobacteria-3]